MQNPSLSCKCHVNDWRINTLAISPYFSKTWPNVAAKSLILKDGIRGIKMRSPRTHFPSVIRFVIGA